MAQVTQIWPKQPKMALKMVPNGLKYLCKMVQMRPAIPMPTSLTKTGETLPENGKIVEKSKKIVNNFVGGEITFFGSKLVLGRNPLII